MSQPEGSALNEGKSQHGSKNRSLKPDLGAKFTRLSREDGDRKYRDKDRSRHSGYSGRNRPPPADGNPHTVILKTRTIDTRSLSPVLTPKLPASDFGAKESSKLIGKVPNSSASMSTPVKVLNEELIFLDSLGDYLTDNPDFVVIGCVGLQWSGKSTILSHLAVSKYTSVLMLLILV